MQGTIQSGQGTAATLYRRSDVLRILHLKDHDLRAWERAGLIAADHDYTFEELGRLRMLRDLRANRISARSIRKHMDAMQRVSGVHNALVESTTVRRGAGLVFRHGGALLDPLTQQFAFDFGNTSREPLRLVGLAEPQRRALAIQELFARAVQLEEAAATRDDAAAIYEEIFNRQPGHAASSINLGTIRYGQRRFAEAERLYRQATVADPEYALAFFDLGNVLDEMQRLDEAIAAYGRAIALVPRYADAHYNLALAHERRGEPRRALRHWLIYVRLDPDGPWASHARRQARKILGSERLTIVSRRGRAAS